MVSSWKLILAACWAGFACVAHAGSTVYNFTGTISLASPSLDQLNGTSFSGTFAYDPNASLWYTLPGQATYTNALTDVTVNFDTFTVGYLPGSPGGYGTVGTDGYDALYLYALQQNLSLTAEPGSLASQVQFLEFFLVDQSGSAFSSTSLPNSLSLQQFTPEVTRLYVQLGDANYQLRGEITSLAPAAVPEPATWAMMLLGLGGTGLVMRRRRGRTGTRTTA